MEFLEQGRPDNYYHFRCCIFHILVRRKKRFSIFGKLAGSSGYQLSASANRFLHHQNSGSGSGISEIQFQARWSDPPGIFQDRVSQYAEIQ